MSENGYTLERVQLAPIFEEVFRILDRIQADLSVGKPDERCDL